MKIETSTIHSSPDRVGRQRFDGWKIVAVLWFLFMSFSFVLYGGSVLNAYMARGLDMPRDSFGLGVSLAYLLMGLGGPMTAFLIRKLGSRVTLSLGMLVLAASALLLGTIVKDVLGFIFAYGGLGGLGLAIGGVLPLQNVISNWFVRKRSLATAVLFTSGGVAGLVTSLLFNFLLEDAGLNWQQVWLLLAGFSLLLALVSFIFVRDHPAQVGQYADGIDQDDSDAVKKQTKKPMRVFQTKEEWSFREAVRQPTAWLLILGSLGMGVSFEFCSAYGVIHLMDIGFPNAAANFSVGALAFFAITGRLVAGYLGDRVELHWLMTAGSAMLVAGCLMIIAPVSNVMIALYALLAGLGQGLVFVSLFAVMPNYFGTKATTAIMGVGMAIISASTSGAIYLGGVIRTDTGSYVTGFILCAIVALVATVTAALAKPPHKEK